MRLKESNTSPENKTSYDSNYIPENNNDISQDISCESAGMEFVKKIGLLGAILFLLLSIIGTLLMLFGGRSDKTPEPEPTEPFSAIVVKKLL